LQKLVDEIRDRLPGLRLNVWYLDDGTICGKASDLSFVIEIIEEVGPSLGIHLNRSKSLIYMPDGVPASTADELPDDIPRVSEGFPLLGSAIGCNSFRDEIIAQRVTKIKSILSRLPDLQDAQMEATLLRKCLAFPKFAFILRTLPPDVVLSSANDFDNAVRSALGEILACPISDWSWTKASLPVNLGGMSLRSATRHAPAAFLGSVCETRGLVLQMLKKALPPSHVTSAIRSLSDTCQRPEWMSTTDIDFPLTQKNLSRAVDAQVHRELLESSPSTRHKALALSTCVPHAGDWLDVVPSSTLGLHLMPWEFRSCALYYLGLPIYQEDASCPACGKPMDVFGDHAVGCGGSNERITRHDLLRDALFAAAQTAALAPKKEVPGLVLGNRSRPADVLLPTWPRGTPTAIDVRVVSSLQSALLAGAALEAGSAAVHAKRQKIARHEDACRAAGIGFLPLVVEVLGGWEDEAAGCIASVGRLQGQRLNSDPGASVRHLFQRMAICLCRGNAALWSGRVGCFPAAIDGVW
jgi:hypothetical protein